MDDVLANLYRLGELFGRLGCSAFAVSSDRDGDGADDASLICGRNLDYFVPSAVGEDVWAATAYLRDHVLAVEYQPDGGRSFLSVGWPGFIGVATGMNRAGIALGSLTVATRRNWPLATPATFMYRTVLERSDGLDGATALMRRSSRTQGNNVLVGSGREGRALVAEFTPWDFVIREPDQGRICATNHFATPQLVDRNAKGAPFASVQRLERMGELCVSGSVDVEAAGAFLIDSTLRTADANEYCALRNPCTIYSVVFEPSRNTLWLRVADGPDREFEPITLG